MNLKRSVPATGPNGSISASIDGEWLCRDWPTVWEFLSASKWEDGSSRQTGTILLFLDGLAIKACLNDRDAGVSAFVSGLSPTALLNLCEVGLATGQLDWRSRPQARPKRS